MVPSTLPINLHIHGLDDWRWAIESDEISLVMLTSFGDWIYKKRDERICVLDTMEGQETLISNNINEFTDKMKTNSFRDQWLLEGFINRMNRENVSFSIGQCVGWKLAPIAGGKTDYDNLDIFDYKTYSHIYSQVVRQCRGLI